jgi:hypothetical protein
MGVSPRLPFVNREAELAFLGRCLEDAEEQAGVVVLTAPPGYGKSSLTDRLRELAGGADRPFCIVDPLVLDTATATRLHEGYFVQRCAEALDASSRDSRYAWPDLQTFLRERRLKNATQGSGSDLVESFLADETIRRPVFNYLARVFNLGRYAPAELLARDDDFAISRCTEYATSLLARHSLVLVVREAHLMDLYSLRTLLETIASHRMPHLILEYTTNHAFAAAHEKLLLRYPFVRHCMLRKMGRDRVEHLLEEAVGCRTRLSPADYENWDGNLRAVKWLTGSAAGLAKELPVLLAPRLATSLADEFNRLDGAHKLLLAILHANGEPIALDHLREVLQRALPDAIGQTPDGLVDAVMADGGLVVWSTAGLRLHNETVAQAIAEADTLRPLIALAEKLLRDSYWAVMERPAASAADLSHGLRHVFRLSGRTRDTAGLLRACAALNDRVAQSSDQRIYVDAVASALESDLQLTGPDRDQLIRWAASLAYRTNDPARAADLLEQLQTQDTFTLTMRAFALQELGRHETSLRLAEVIASDAQSPDEGLAAELIKALVGGCLGEVGASRDLLNRIVADPNYQNSPLLGYAYRFFEVVEGFADCLPKLLLSAAWFGRFDLPIPAAYSQLPAAVFLARLGRLGEARTLMSQAVAALEGTVHDKQLLLNDRAAIELLAPKPDYATCVEVLSEALRHARDDFSELTILTNLALARSGIEDHAAAAASARQSMAILESHDFADRDIYWPICFNAAQVFGASDDLQERAAALRFPEQRGGPVSVNKDYWSFRYGRCVAVPEGFEYLTALPRHPVYLSHWLMEVEGMERLMQQPPQ